MSRVVRVGTRVIGLLALLLSAAPAWAQDAGIAGVAKDTSGAVLPGVTVTATSPALIEKERVAITDAEGRYVITQLRPGEYTVAFALDGFSTVVREGVRLAAGFTANIEAEMRVGSLQETITVTGASPVVDVANVRRQTVVTNELLEALPTSTKSIGQLTTLTTGVTGLGDVGGTYQVEPGQDVVSGGGRFHGKGGTKVSYDGMGMENSSGNNSYQLNAASVEEMVMSTSGISADTNADGIVVNIVPKEGGNTFRTMLSGLYANSAMESHEPVAGPERPGPADRQQDAEAVRLLGERRRPDHARQAVVLRGAAELGCRADAGRHLLEQDPERVPDAARRRLQGREVDALGGSARGSQQRPPRVVRLDSGPRHLAGVGEEQVQRHLRRAARLQLRLGQRRTVARVLPVVVPVRAEPPLPGDLELAGDEPPAASRPARPRRFRSGTCSTSPG